MINHNLTRIIDHILSITAEMRLAGDVIQIDEDSCTIRVIFINLKKLDTFFKKIDLLKIRDNSFLEIWEDNVDDLVHDVFLKIIV